MAVQPIDLQTMFTQVDKVGKEQASLREGTILHQSILGEQAQRKLEERMKSVNDVQNTGDGIKTIKDMGSRREKRDGLYQRPDQKEEAESQDGKPAFKDPALGKNVDFSG